MNFLGSTDIALGQVGLARVNALLAQLGYRQTRINMTTAELTQRIFVLADPRYSTATDRRIYELGLPPVPPRSASAFSSAWSETR